jgi:hypothetical protein
LNRRQLLNLNKGDPVIWHLLGGPLDGATVDTPEHSIQPEMFHFSNDRLVHHYLWHDGTEFRYLSQDTDLDDRRQFEVWWKSQSHAESAKEAAWEAWNVALSRL